MSGEILIRIAGSAAVGAPVFACAAGCRMAPQATYLPDSADRTYPFGILPRAPDQAGCAYLEDGHLPLDISLRSNQQKEQMHLGLTEAPEPVQTLVAGIASGRTIHIEPDHSNPSSLQKKRQYRGSSTRLHHPKFYGQNDFQGVENPFVVVYHYYLAVVHIHFSYPHQR